MTQSTPFFDIQPVWNSRFSRIEDIPPEIHTNWPYIIENDPREPFFFTHIFKVTFTGMTYHNVMDAAANLIVKATYIFADKQSNFTMYYMLLYTTTKAIPLCKCLHIAGRTQPLLISRQYLQAPIYHRLREKELAIIISYFVEHEELFNT